VLLSRRGADDSDISLAYRGIRDGRPLIEVAGGSRRRAEMRHLGTAGESTGVPVDDQSVGLEVLEADEVALHLAISTDMAISYDGDPRAAGPGVAESLLGDSEASRLLAWLLREGGADAHAAARHFGWSERVARERLEQLVAAGGAAVAEDGRFAPRMVARRRRRGLEGEVWSRLGVDQEREVTGSREALSRGIVARMVASPQGRMVVCSLPTAGLAALAAALIALGTASVSDPIRIVGVIAFATISGLLPPMLLLAARRRSDVAGAGGAGILAGRVLMGLTAVSSLVALILHATILWTDPIERAVAALATVCAFATVVLAARHGAFRPAALVELRQSREHGPVRILSEESGRPLQTEISIGGRELGVVPEFSLEQAAEGLVVRGHPAAARELRISAQRLGSSGTAQALPLTTGLEQQVPVRLSERGGSASFPIAGDWTLVVCADEPG
jgi:hypothetical protein